MQRIRSVQDNRLHGSASTVGSFLSALLSLTLAGLGSENSADGDGLSAQGNALRVSFPLSRMPPGRTGQKATILQDRNHVASTRL
jgi:hypothetical protein